MAPKAALYLRVSTEKQTAANQLESVEALAKARGYEPIVYGETASAVAKERPKFQEMMADAKRGRIGAVVVWSLDRLHRSMGGMVRDVLELQRLGVRVLSVREPWIDADGPVRELLISIFGWVAQQERVQLVERTKAGIERAKKEGKTLGRPRVPAQVLALAVQRVEAGGKVKETSSALGLSERSLRRELKRKQAA